jgi:FkbM family methyltransferase
MRIPRPKLNVIELAMWAAFIATLAYIAGVGRTQERLRAFISSDNVEAESLAKTYGPSHYSEHVEEWILKDFFKNRRDGVFVEVGANHHQRSSNTYYLEHALGWSGVAIEPQVKFAAGYREYRPRTTFVPLFISDVSNQRAVLYVTDKNDSVASGNREFTELWGATTPTPATTSTLDDVLDRLKIERIDFMSMDIELAEPQALAGFSIRRFNPELVAVEAHLPVRQQILDYFVQHNYVPVGRYWRADAHNIWFAPVGKAARSGSAVALDSH